MIILFSLKLMTGISWMLQEAAQCPPEDYLVYDDHLGEEELASGEFESVEYEYSYDVKSEKVCIQTSSIKYEF